MNTLVDLLQAGLAQHARLITLACAQQQGLVDSLAAEQFTGREGVNALFVFELDALSTSVDIDIDTLVGEELTLQLLQPDGARRAWHGACTRAAMIGADGGVARYRLRLEPALVQLQRRRNSRLFFDQDVRAIVGDLLAYYPEVRCAFDVSRTLAPRVLCTQYRETDFAFLMRLLASEGLNYRFDHVQDDASAQDAVAQARHSLVIYDSQAEVPPMPGGAVLRFHGVRATDTDDAIDLWCARRAMQANSAALSSWDPQQLVAPGAAQQSNLDAGVLPAMSIYDGSGECIASGPATPGGDAGGHGRLMLAALEQDNKVFDGAGAVRRLAAGHGFTLSQHGNYPAGEDAFTVLWVTHAARNNLKAGIPGAMPTTLEDGTYRNRFACVRSTVAVAPGAVAARSSSTMRGMQTALVAGMPDAVATSTRDHQVKLQFAWERHFDADKGAWVRTAEALAGGNWGSQFVPRIGTDALVAFAEGDIDRPFIVGQLHDDANPPPYPAGVDGDANHDGALSGIDTGNFDADGYNQLQFDDTQDQLRMRLASSSAATELHLGQLVEQTIGSAERGESRGSGFELRTDAWTTLRGAAGVLLTTSARAATDSSVTSTQMDTQEAVALSKGAATLHAALKTAATRSEATTSKEALAAHTALAGQVDPKVKATFPGPVGGHAVSKPKGATRDIDAAQPVERFGAAAVLFDAAAAMNWATPASTVVSAGQHVQWTTQSDHHVAAGATFSAVSGAGAGWFTHGGGIQAFAGNGAVSLQAHTDKLEIIADKEVVAMSATEVVTIAAKTKIVIQAGKSSITLEGGDITFACPGKFTAKGGKHIFDGGYSKAASTLELPDSRLQLFDEAFIVMDRQSGEPVARQPYRLKRENGSYEEGFTDEAGHTHVVGSAEAESLAIELLDPKYTSRSEARKSATTDDTPKFKVASESVMTPVAMKKRKKVRVDLPQCWIEDYFSEVVENRETRPYFITTTPAGEPVEIAGAGRYKLYIPVRSNTDVIVEVRFKIDARTLLANEEIREMGLSDKEKDESKKERLAAFENLKSQAERGVRLMLNDKFRLEISDPVCKIITLPIIYTILFLESGEHYIMDVQTTVEADRESVDGNTMRVKLTTSSWTFAHEYGHTIGLPDEYSYDRKASSFLRYFKPDGTADDQFEIFPDKVQTKPSAASFLSTSNNIKVFERHAWNIAIETQDILTKKIGRRIKCRILST
jgi:type VI secretion system secreted protein VgrG